MKRWLPLGGLATLLAVYVSIAQQVQSLSRQQDDDVMQIALPGFVQVLFYGGDRHLAGNFNVLRSMMVPPGITDDGVYSVQAQLQRQTSILNPYHEDNYYIAAAVLAWEGQVEVAQFVLERATNHRGWDFLAPFFAGFNQYHFYKDGVAAGQLANLAADRLSGDQRLAMRDIAAKWLGLADDLDESMRMLQGMAQSTRDPRLQYRLAQRVERVRQLKALRTAAQRYRSEHGAPPQSLEAMLEAGLLEAIPEDPLRQGYRLDPHGQPQFNTTKERKPS